MVHCASVLVHAKETAVLKVANAVLANAVILLMEKTFFKTCVILYVFVYSILYVCLLKRSINLMKLNLVGYNLNSTQRTKTLPLVC